MGRFGNTYMGADPAPFKFIANDASLTAGQTLTPTSLIANVFSADEVIVTMKATCAASSTATVRFNFIGRCHNDALWPTVADFYFDLTLNGTTQVVVNKILDAIPYTQLKLLSITNYDSSNALSGVNAYVTYKH